MKHILTFTALLLAPPDALHAGENGAGVDRQRHAEEDGRRLRHVGQHQRPDVLHRRRTE